MMKTLAATLLCTTFLISGHATAQDSIKAEVKNQASGIAKDSMKASTNQAVGAAQNSMRSVVNNTGVAQAPIKTEVTAPSSGMAKAAGSHGTAERHKHRHRNMTGYNHFKKKSSDKQ
ncbi:hypothetical protein [Cupriavidus necator]